MNISKPTLVAACCLYLVASTGDADGPPDGVVGNPPPPSSGLLYSVDQSSGDLVTIDPNTAQISVVGPTGFNFVEALTYHSPTDTLLGVDNDSDQLITIDRYTGLGAAIGPIGRDFVFGLTYSEWDDTLYGVDTDTNDLLTLDPTTGAASVRFPLSFDFVGGLTDNPETGVLYGVDYGADQVFTIGMDGGIILTGPIVDVIPSAMQGVAFDLTTGDLFALSIRVGPDELLRINRQTDAVQMVGLLDDFAGASLAFVPFAIPEPSAAAICIATALCLGARRRRIHNA